MSSGFHGNDLAATTIAGVRYRTTAFPPHYSTRPHAHDRSYFCLILGGPSEQTFGSAQRERRRGSVYFYPAGERQSERFGVEGGKLFSFEIDATNAMQSFPVRSPAAGIASRIYDELRTPDDDSSLVAEDLTLLLVAETTRLRERDTRAAPPWLGIARDYLRAHFRERVTLAAVAAEAGVHTVHLSSRFHRHFGCTFGDYLRALRVDFARARLARTRDPIADIALDAGFASQPHLTKHFRAQTLMTPARYRALFA